MDRITIRKKDFEDAVRHLGGTARYPKSDYGRKVIQVSGRTKNDARPGRTVNIEYEEA